MDVQGIDVVLDSKKGICPPFPKPAYAHDVSDHNFVRIQATNFFVRFCGTGVEREREAGVRAEFEKPLDLGFIQEGSVGNRRNPNSVFKISKPQAIQYIVQDVFPERLGNALDMNRL